MIKASNINFDFEDIPLSSNQLIEKNINQSWNKISPAWPLENLIAVNPIAGLETLAFEDALQEAAGYFQLQELPKGMLAVNRESIKWLQVYFDQGQSSIAMPLKSQGLLQSVCSLLKFDKKVNSRPFIKNKIFDQNPLEAIDVINECINYLTISPKEQALFFTLILSSLSGWSSYIQYLTNWSEEKAFYSHNNPLTHQYLALRLVLCCLLWPQAKKLIRHHQVMKRKSFSTTTYQKITNAEKEYVDQLVQQLKSPKKRKITKRPKAQLVFCIDVRSEPFRRALESRGKYETFGFAGFFGLPVSIQSAISQKTYASCPVLLKPAYTVKEKPGISFDSYQKKHTISNSFKQAYQSLKYSFTTPFCLAETAGLANGLWMATKSLAPSLANLLSFNAKSKQKYWYAITPDINGIPFEQQIDLAKGALQSMGLTKNFAPLVVLCGHTSQTENNPQGSALECGACAGHAGGPNARILAKILNASSVRSALQSYGIAIPSDCDFIAAQHNTTTDEVLFFEHDFSRPLQEKINPLKIHLHLARMENCAARSATLRSYSNPVDASLEALKRSQDWAEVRPEWGLSKNASFIIGPRRFTKGINLNGRSFLHSYEWQQDNDLSVLTSILTAPVIVAQWINAQYLFSTIDNVAFGGGSKITSNITGKVGVMQGNASDLMHGLPLQCVYEEDASPYHQAIRLVVVVYAPTSSVESVIKKQAILKRLFGNGWLHLICIDTPSNKIYNLKRELSWQIIP